MKLLEEEYPLIEEFSKKLVKKLEKGREDYGMKYLKLDREKVFGEIEEELLDVAGWALMFWIKLKRTGTLK